LSQVLISKAGPVTFRTAKLIADHLVLRPLPTISNPNPMLRLSFGVMTAKEDMSLQHLHLLMTRGPLQASLIFPDTGVITTALPQQFWNVALGLGPVRQSRLQNGKSSPGSAD